MLSSSYKKPNVGTTAEHDGVRSTTLSSRNDFVAQIREGTVEFLIVARLWTHSRENRFVTTGGELPLRA
ncbi:MAG: hypothetical protein DME86_01645 [Verrucomicrobia bacterium]|nr:MAG: hypothetical protein DME86_01645 [Verrucomicrobiota bacterium]